MIALFIESVRRPEAFVGRSRRRRTATYLWWRSRRGAPHRRPTLALSHSGAIAGDDAAYQALFERYGVLPVSSIDELAASALLLSDVRRPAAGWSGDDP